MTTHRSDPTPTTPVPTGYFRGRCCAKCKTPYNCGNSGCACHADEKRQDPRQIIARTVADLANDPTIPPRRGIHGIYG